MNTAQTNLDTARAAFEQIIAKCAPLKHEFRETPEHEYVDLELEFPTQERLLFDVLLYLSGDELHLVTGAFWCEWFPVKDENRVNEYTDAISCLIRGDYRLLETLRFNTPVKSLLQKPSTNGWETVASWRRLHFPIGKKSQRIIQNTAFAHPQ